MPALKWHDCAGSVRVIDRYQELFGGLWPVLGRSKHIHFVGIAGSGMSGIAEVYRNLGYTVSGSDLADNAVVHRLRSLGIQVYHGHDASHIHNAEVVVRSTAVAEHNPELIAAQQHRIPVMRRAEMLAELMRFRYGIAIAGTHGKTTTTSLIASVLAEGGLDPTFVIGGQLNSAGANAKLGAGRYLVAEADESDASFLYLQPMIAVVTNIDRDHMATYLGEFGKLKETFVAFLHHLPFYGVAVLCLDDPVVREILPRVSRTILTYGLSDDADVQATDIQQTKAVTRFNIRHGQHSYAVQLNLPGKHNVLNALAAYAVGHQLQIPHALSAKALSEFQGIGRRFQQYGYIQLKTANIFFIDDYGHHPTEIAAVLAAVRAGWPNARIVLAFQPHRYSRTFDLFDDFANVLSSVDVLVLLQVYAAGEPVIEGADAHALARAIRSRGRIEPVYVERAKELVSVLPDLLRDDDVLITMGAGDIGAAAQRLAQDLSGL